MIGDQRDIAGLGRQRGAGIEQNAPGGPAARRVGAGIEQHARIVRGRRGAVVGIGETAGALDLDRPALVLGRIRRLDDDAVRRLDRTTDRDGRARAGGIERVHQQRDGAQRRDRAVGGHGDGAAESGVELDRAQRIEAAPGAIDRDRTGLRRAALPDEDAEVFAARRTIERPLESEVAGLGRQRGQGALHDGGAAIALVAARGDGGRQAGGGTGHRERAQRGGAADQIVERDLAGRVGDGQPLAAVDGIGEMDQRVAARIERGRGRERHCAIVALRAGRIDGIAEHDRIGRERQAGQRHPDADTAAVDRDAAARIADRQAEGAVDRAVEVNIAAAVDGRVAGQDERAVRRRDRAIGYLAAQIFLLRPLIAGQRNARLVHREDIGLAVAQTDRGQREAVEFAIVPTVIVAIADLTAERDAAGGRDRQRLRACGGPVDRAGKTHVAAGERRTAVDEQDRTVIALRTGCRDDVRQGDRRAGDCERAQRGRAFLTGIADRAAERDGAGAGGHRDVFGIARAVERAGKSDIARVGGQGRILADRGRAEIALPAQGRDDIGQGDRRARDCERAQRGRAFLAGIADRAAKDDGARGRDGQRLSARAGAVDRAGKTDTAASKRGTGADQGDRADVALRV